jgi:hypothetical protein
MSPQIRSVTSAGAALANFGLESWLTIGFDRFGFRPAPRWKTASASVSIPASRMSRATRFPRGQALAARKSRSETSSTRRAVQAWQREALPKTDQRQ